MKLLVSPEKIKEALSKVSATVDKRNIRPMLSNCLFLAEKNKLIIKSTDLEISSKVIINCKIEKEGSFCINGKNVTEVIREFQGGELLLETEIEGNTLKIEHENIHYTLPICQTNEFPDILFQEKEKGFILTADEINQIINKTSFAVSTDETRPYLNGIFLQENEKSLKAVATDGHRLALLDFPDFKFPEGNPSLKLGVIIPRKGIVEMKRMAESYPENKIVCSLNESFLFLSVNEEYFLSVRLIARDYPKYNSVIPSKSKEIMKIAKTPFLKAVKRSKIVSSEKTNGIKILLEEGSVTVSAQHPVLGSFSEKIPAEYNGAPISIGFNARYLMDTLSVFSDTAFLEFGINSEITPVLVKSSAEKNFLGIIMPLKL